MDDSGLPQAILGAAGEIGAMDSALDAELLLSTLLGGVYSAVEPDRGLALDSFTGVLRDYLVDREEPHAPLVAAVLAALTGVDPGAPPDQPAWVTQLGRVKPLTGYAYGDRYGDQTSYLATFEYGDAGLGGPEHALVVLVDHDLGLATDVLLVTPADQVIEQLRQDVLAGAEAMTWLTEVPLATVRTVAFGYLLATDVVAELPAGESLAANRALALARLSRLPLAAAVEDDVLAEGLEEVAPVEVEDSADRQPGLIEEFFDSAEASLAGLDPERGARGESVTYCLGLVVDYAKRRGGDPLRWSPQAVTTFLTEWVHERAILDDVDVATLPGTLSAWAAFAGRRLNLPEQAVRDTLGRVREVRPEFERLCATGEKQSPAARAMEQLVAEGVDVADEAAVDAWLRAYNLEHG